MERRPSGIPDGKVIPTIRRGEVDYDAEMHAHHDMTREIRRSMSVILAVMVALAVVFAVTGRTGGLNLVVFLGTPLLLVFIGNEIAIRWIRKRLVGRGR